MMKELWKPCKMQPKNIGLHCEAQSGCEKCGWNPKRAKEIHQSFNRGEVGQFDDAVFKKFVYSVGIKIKDVGEGSGIGDALLAQKRRGCVDWKIKDLIKLANYFETTPQNILENFFNAPKQGGDTNG